MSTKKLRTSIGTVEGRLLMVDFNKKHAHCRIDTRAGEQVFCFFEEEQGKDILENLLQNVRITGDTTQEPSTERIISIKIHNVKRVEKDCEKDLDVLQQSFWGSTSLDQLASQQNVKLLSNIKTLFGTWPGYDGDGFESAIEELRHTSLNGEGV